MYTKIDTSAILFPTYSIFRMLDKGKWKKGAKGTFLGAIR